MKLKKLTAIALSTLLLVGSMPVMALADDAATTEGTQTSQGHQVESVKFNYDEKTGKGTAIATYDDGRESDPVAAEEEKRLAATCEEPEYLWLKAQIDGQWYHSGELDDKSTAFKPNGDKNNGPHAWVLDDTIVKTFPTCEEEGEAVEQYHCSKCNEKKEETLPLEAQGHKWGEWQTRNTGFDNVDEKTLELIDDSKDGFYTVETYRVCSECEEEEIDQSKTQENVIYAKKIAEERITSQEGIETNLLDMAPDEVPSDEEIELKDCSKDGRYQITKFTAEGKPVSQRWITVKAHHMEAPVAIEFDNADDKALCTVETLKNGTVKVTNNSCYKTVKYYEVIHCTAKGCKNPKCNTKKYTCENTDLKEVSRTAKEAAPEGKHIINGDAKKVVLAEAAKDYADYEALKEFEKDPKNYVKVSENTATCTEDGKATVTMLCKICKAEVEDIEVKTRALGHERDIPVEENYVAPTCKAMGSYDAVVYCKRCHEVLEKREGVKIPALPHTNQIPNDDMNGVFEDDTENEDGAYIIFKGDKVVDPYDGSYMNGFKNGTKYSNYIGYYRESNEFGVTAVLATNCKNCGDHIVELDGKNIELTITAIEKQKESGEAGFITIKADYTTTDKTELTKEITVPYFSTMNSYNGRTEKAPINGLSKDEDGKYRYYKDGEVLDNFTGIAEYNGGEFFVSEGELCDGANGLNEFGGKWYFLSNGQIQRGYNGLALYDNNWFYLTNGELNTAVNGLVPYNGGTFLFAAGRLVQEYSGLWQNFDGQWYFLSLGQVQTQYTGVAMYDGAFFVVEAGKFNIDYNGTIDYNGAKFNVVAGQLYDQVA